MQIIIPHRQLDYPMGLKLLLIAGSLLTIFSFLKEAFIPNLQLAILLGFAVGVDLITGVIKSFSLDPDSINSSSARLTSVKVSWYFIIVIGSGFCKYMVSTRGLFTQECAKILTDCALWYCIWAEVLSISENGIATRGLPPTLILIFKSIHQFVSLQFLKGWFLRNLADKYDDQYKHTKNK